MMTPKELFLVSGHASALKLWAASDAFEPACQHALMQLRSELPPSTQPGMPTDALVAFDAHSQLVGAARVLEILHTLSDPPPKPKESPKNTLDYAR